MKTKKKNLTAKEVKNFVAQNPKMAGGNVKLMTGDVSFDLEKRLVKLRKQTQSYKLNYKTILKTKA